MNNEKGKRNSEKVKTSILFTFSLLLFTCEAAVPLSWTVETTRAQPATFEAYQGETIDFEAALQAKGKPLEAPLNYSFFWQTNGMGNAYWEKEVEVGSRSRTEEFDNSTVGLRASTSTNVLFATWSPEMDVGAKVYNCFIGSPSNIYHAAFQLRLRPSPGAIPNALPLPTPVIDFARVRVLNPPWSGGGGGGVDTNAVRDIIRETVDGEGRYLPKYLHFREMDDTYPEAAAEWYAQADYSHGSCSARRSGNLLERNYDWNFNDMAEYVIRVPAGPDRFASLAVCNVGTNITEEMVASGKTLRWFKALPGHAVDGINENGVVCEVNVVSTNGVENWHGDPDADGIHCLAAVRWVLDHATSAEMAASNLAERVYVPEGMGNFHYMLADESSTIIVENGRMQYDWRGFPPDRSRVILTNYLVLMPDEESGLYCYLPEESYFFYGKSGSGLERYVTLQDALSPDPRTNITNVWYTNAYRRETNPPWVSDLRDVLAYTNDIFDAWASHPKEYFRNKATNGIPWWQTVHTSVYDITNRVLRIAVQETDDWYVFQVPSAGGVKVETDPTVPAWAKQPNPPQGMPSTGLVWNATASAVKTANGAKTIGANDVGAYGKVDDIDISEDWNHRKSITLGGVMSPPSVGYLYRSAIVHNDDYDLVDPMHPAIPIVETGFLAREFGYNGEGEPSLLQAVNYGKSKITTIDSWSGVHDLLVPFGISGMLAVESWLSLSAMLDDASTNQTTRSSAGAKIMPLIQQPVSNLVVECRDIYHDDELDVTFKKVVSGGRVYMKVIAVDGENAQ